MTNLTIQQLFQKYLEDTITKDELQRLYALIGEGYSPDQLDPLLQATFTEGKGTMSTDAAERQEILSGLMDRINGQPHQRTRTISLRQWVGYAAMLLLIAGAGFLFYTIRTGKAPAPLANHQPAKDIPAPKGAKATLTLSGGQQIVLDSAGNGQLAVQGNTRIQKLKNGQLAYAAAGNNPDEILYNTLSTTKGGQTMVVLSDGTKVWLNALSSLKYPTAFGKERTVTLDGEAYFEVSGDKSKPFKVNVRDKGEVVVLGTHFNINAYRDEPTINTTLLEGSVRVSSGAAATGGAVPDGSGAGSSVAGGSRTGSAAVSSATIKPGQQVRQKDDQLIVSNNVNIEEVMAWKNGYFSFDGASTEEIMRQVSRWYDVSIVYEGNTKDERFAGSMPRSANASRLLEVLSLTKTVQFVIADKTITVKPYSP
ncbi:MAG TPA: FecR domain-containing protein [Puia sp.]|nr:FecR domain-containing protein [Puia sp.]